MRRAECGVTPDVSWHSRAWYTSLRQGMIIIDRSESHGARDIALAIHIIAPATSRSRFTLYTCSLGSRAGGGLRMLCNIPIRRDTAWTAEPGTRRAGGDDHHRQITNRTERETSRPRFTHRTRDSHHRTRDSHCGLGSQAGWLAVWNAATMRTSDTVTSGQGCRSVTVIGRLGRDGSEKATDQLLVRCTEQTTPSSRS